jgi:hypothetical protein
MSSSVLVAPLSTIAMFPFGKVAGLVIGATARPTIARMLSERPMVDKLTINYHTGAEGRAIDNRRPIANSLTLLPAISLIML